MVLSTHAVVGGAIGRLLPVNPVAAFVLAFISHFVLDLIPHWDYPLASEDRNTDDPHSSRLRSGWPLYFDVGKVLVDLLIGVMIVWWFVPMTDGPWWFSGVWWGLLGAVFPDGLQFLYMRFQPRVLKGLQRFHRFIHAKQDFNDRPFLGIFLQTVLVISVLLIIDFLVGTDLGMLFASLKDSFRLKDLLDIGVTAVLVYFALLFIKRTRSFFIFNSVIILFGLYYLASFFDLALIRQGFQSIVTFIIVIFVVVFQREIRRFFDWLSSSATWQLNAPGIVSSDGAILLTKAIADLAKRRIGAIVVIPGESPVERALEGGHMLDGRVSVPLLLSIFDPTSPGHDGAVLIERDRVKRFGVHLPLAEKFAQIADFGTRHRAAVGITERTDALAIVVSEERGTISVAENGQLEVLTGPELLLERLQVFVKENRPIETEGIWHFVIRRNFWIKLAAIVLAGLLWFGLVFQIGVVNKDLEVPVEFRYVPTELMIGDLSTKTVKVTVSGSNHDLLNFKPDSLKIVIDLAPSGPGWQEAVINQSNVIKPSYLSILEIKPEKVKFQLVRSTIKNNN